MVSMAAVPVKQVLLIGMVLAMLLPVAAAQDTYSPCVGDTFSDQIACMFLPADVELTPQKMLFGVVLPFLMFFAIIFYGMKAGTPLDRPESFIVALGIALFLIPSGASLVIGQLFIDAFNAIGTTLGFGAIEGIGGGAAGGSPADIDALWPMMQKNGGAVAILAGILLSIVFSLTDKGISRTEWLTVPFVVAGVWFVLGGAAVMVQIVGFALIFIIGLWLMGALNEKTGATGKLFGMIGLLILGWGFTEFGSSSLLQGTGGQGTGGGQIMTRFGDLILNLLATSIIVIIVLIVAAVFVAYHLLLAKSSGS